MADDTMEDVPSSTSSIYSHLTGSLSSLPRHLIGSTTSNYRSPDSQYSAFSAMSPYGSDRPLSAVAAGRTIASNSTPTNHRTLLHAPPPQQPFVPTVNFEQLEQRRCVSPSPMFQTRSISPMPFASSASPQHQHQQLEQYSPTSPSNFQSSPFQQPQRFQPDFFPSNFASPNEVPPCKVQDSMDELMEATLSHSSGSHHQLQQMNLHQSQLQHQPQSQPSLQQHYTPTMSSRNILRLSGGGASGEGRENRMSGPPPSLLNRSRFAHLGQASVGTASSSSPNMSARRLTPNSNYPTTISADSNMDDLSDAFGNLDAIPVSSAFTQDSSPLQTLRRLGGGKQLSLTRSSYSSNTPSSLSRTGSLRMGTPLSPPLGSSTAFSLEQQQSPESFSPAFGSPTTSFR